MRIEDYQTLVFDCDGVILDSNKVKSDAFFAAALPYGEEAAAKLVEYHKEHGGVSRFKKFEYFLNSIVGENSSGPGVQALLSSYAQEVRAGLMNCAVADGLEELRQATASARWLIVSGGAQSELREIFTARGLDVLFDGGIFGSPDAKEDILKRELSAGNIRPAALFLGDSRYDHVASSACGLDFVFISQWTEFSAWKEYCEVQQLSRVKNLRSLVD